MELLEKVKDTEQIRRTPIIVYTAKDLSREETNRLHKLASTVILKTADSRERLLDETSLFLHRVESRLPREKQQIIHKLRRTDEILKNKKVLLVDDDMRNIYSLTSALEGEGMRCITAENGQSAVTLFSQTRDIDIILMDVMMPGLDGYETTKEIRQLPGGARMPVIALTAKAMKGDREKCLDAGMSDYISKPVNIEQLLSLLRVWLYR
jgi:CheY-like chemotaxis protein